MFNKLQNGKNGGEDKPFILIKTRETQIFPRTVPTEHSADYLEGKEFSIKSFPPKNLKSCNLLLKTLSKIGDQKSVFELFNSLESIYGFTPDSFSWLQLLQSVVKIGTIDESLVLLDDWLIAVKNGLPVGSHDHFFNAVMTKCQVMRDLDTVEILYDKMISNKMMPNVYIYTTIITTAIDCNRHGIAEEYFIKMLADKVPVTHASWRVITAPLGRSMDTQGYRRYISHVRNSGVVPTIEMWRDLIGTYGKLGKCDDTVRTLQEMETLDKIIPDATCYLRAIRSVCQARNDWEKGLFLLRKCREINLSIASTAWTYIIEACVNTKYLNKYGSVKELNKVRNYEDVGGFNKLKMHNKLNYVFCLLDEMQKIDKLIPDSFLWNTIVNAFTKKFEIPSSVAVDSFETMIRGDNDKLYYTSSEKLDTYFSYLYDEPNKIHITEETALLERFISMCTPKNQANLFSELLRPLLYASLSIGIIKSNFHFLNLVYLKCLSLFLLYFIFIFMPYHTMPSFSFFHFSLSLFLFRFLDVFLYKCLCSCF